jgi:nucleoside-diphosphate-sugar epimerase
VNAEGTRQLIRAVAEAAPSLSRFIYVSSLAAAGPSAPGRPREEDHPAQPVSAYGRSKLAGENAVREAPFPWTIVRPPAVYGPRDREFLRLFRVIRWHVAPLLAPPGQELSFVYIGDLVEALLSAAARGATQCVYFATHPEVATVRDFVAGIHAAVQRAIGRDGERTLRVVRVPRPITRLVLLGTLSWARLTGRATLLSPDKGQEFLAEAWTCTAARLERDTGWRARVGLSEGLAATASWYRKQGWL